MNARLNRLRIVAFLLALAICTICLTADLARWRVDGLILVAIGAWLVMVGLCVTDMEPDPDPNAHTSLDDREHHA